MRKKNIQKNMADREQNIQLIKSIRFEQTSIVLCINYQLKIIYKKKWNPEVQKIHCEQYKAQLLGR